MRQRAKVSTLMYALSRVGISIGRPSQLSNRFSMRLTFWMNGILNCKPGVRDRLADDFPELGNDDMVDLADRVEAPGEDQEENKGDHGGQERERLFHRARGWMFWLAAGRPRRRHLG